MSVNKKSSLPGIHMKTSGQDCCITNWVTMPKWHGHLVLWNSQSIVTGIIAILMSRNLSNTKLVWMNFFLCLFYTLDTIDPSPLCFLFTTLFLCLQQIGLVVVSLLNALISAACSIGLLLAIGVTVAYNGQGLMVGCNDTEVPINARSPISAKCPFDTTRIYVSSLYLTSFCRFFSSS